MSTGHNIESLWNLNEELPVLHWPVGMSVGVAWLLTDVGNPLREVPFPKHGVMPTKIAGGKKDNREQANWTHAFVHLYLLHVRAAARR